MEKPSSHYRLSVIKTLVAANKVRATFSAFKCAKEAGVRNLHEMCEIVLSLTASDFYKSITAYTDHRLWQDVYHGKTTTGIPLYIKLTVVEDVLIVSFKEL